MSKAAEGLLPKTFPCTVSLANELANESDRGWVEKVTKSFAFWPKDGIVLAFSNVVVWLKSFAIAVGVAGSASSHGETEVNI